MHKIKNVRISLTCECTALCVGHSDHGSQGGYLSEVTSGQPEKLLCSEETLGTNLGPVKVNDDFAVDSYGFRICKNYFNVSKDLFSQSSMCSSGTLTWDSG